MKDQNIEKLNEVQKVLLNINFDPWEDFYKYFVVSAFSEQDYYPYVDVFPYPDELKEKKPAKEILSET